MFWREWGRGGLVMGDVVLQWASYFDPGPCSYKQVKWQTAVGIYHQAMG